MAELCPVVFLPGILMPAMARYAPLRAALGSDRPAVAKELEIYGAAAPAPDYSIEAEVAGLDHFAAERGFDALHLYGHSAGASIALAYTARHPGRVLSLSVDEPASDFSADDRAAMAHDLPADLDELPAAERMARFASSLVRPGVELPGPPPLGGDPESAKRPAALGPFSRALARYDLDLVALGQFDQPVYYSYGSLSNERWEAMGERFRQVFPNCTVERFEGLHHLNTSHVAEPDRVASSLHRIWQTGESTRR